MLVLYYNPALTAHLLGLPLMTLMMVSNTKLARLCGSLKNILHAYRSVGKPKM
ncbi:hypothetical protein DPMN_157778 [Dreissena polymorpha]|uniref:Uncharacterized protein n=1 Tax=Dreissena polymorpha TaxID=45954 RepID=A0A9D4EIP1_DREPO|nr:hypothetical protein DPMN_157778 [Dreissena polymorpha]